MMLMVTFLPTFSSLLLLVELVTSCPERCTCSNVGEVRCTSPSERLVKVPSPLPEGTLELSISDQAIGRIRKGDFTEMERPAFNLSIVRSGLRAIGDGAFKNLTDLLHLNLQENEIFGVSWETFDGLDQLVSLQMHDNAGLVIRPCALGALFNLRRLTLAFTSTPFSFGLFAGEFSGGSCSLPDLNIHYRLEYLSMGTTGVLQWQVNQLEDVQELDIRERSVPAFFDLDVSTMFALRILHLRDLLALPALRHDRLLEVRIVHPSFTHLPANAFTNTPSLDRCAITEGSLTYIHEDAFKGLTKLQSVDFSLNRIHTLPTGLFEGVSLPVNSLILDNNPLSCNCSIAWLLDQSTLLSVDGVCDSPENVAGASLHQIAFGDSTPCNGNEEDVTPVVEMTDDVENAPTEGPLPVTTFEPTQDSMLNATSSETAYTALGVSIASTVVLIVGYVFLCGLWLKRGKDIRDLKILIGSLSTGEHGAEHMTEMHAATSGRREVASDATGTRPNRVRYARNIVETGACSDTHRTNGDISHPYYYANDQDIHDHE